LLQIRNKGRFERSVLPLELKTGRATFSMEHKGQVGHAKGQGQSYFSETHNIQGMIQTLGSKLFFLNSQYSRND
jgi:hypothetical protein